MKLSNYLYLNTFIAKIEVLKQIMKSKPNAKVKSEKY